MYYKEIQVKQMALVVLKQFFGLPVWENETLEILSDRAHIAWERWEHSQARLRAFPLNTFVQWGEFRELRFKTEDYKAAFESARKAAEERVKEEAKKMKRLGETEKVFRGRVVITIIVLEDDGFFVQRRPVPVE